MAGTLPGATICPTPWTDEVALEIIPSVQGRRLPEHWFD